MAPDRVISTVAPEARHAHKSRQKKIDGFTSHIVIEPDTGLVTAAALTKAAGAANGNAARGGELNAAITKAGHTPIIKPMPLGRAIAGGFTVDNFTIDESANTATCPAGNTRPISAKGRVSFGAACASCPLMSQCTTARNGKKMHIHPHDRLRREHRARATDPEFQSVYRQHRPMVERSIAWMTRGARRVPYRGVVKNNAWWVNRAAGINLKRLLNLGLNHQNGSWALG